MKNLRPTPPQWLDWLLSGLCKKEVFEIIQGDLYELYERNVQAKGPRKANLLYIKDTLTTLRPTLLKQLEGNHQLNPYGMFKNHFKTSVRNLRRNPLFSIINVVGLAISMSAGIMMIVFLSELYGIDDFHEKRNQIYRVTTTQPGLMGDQIDHLATASYYIADQAKAQLPEIEEVVVMSWRYQAEIQFEKRKLALSGFYTTPSFLEVLTYPLIHGNPHTALENPESVILTASAAKKLFPELDNPMGQTVEVAGVGGLDQGIVTGVISDPPANSYLDFEMLVPMSGNPMISQDFRNNPHNTFENYVYLLLNDQADHQVVETKIAQILSNHEADLSAVKHTLEPMGSFVTGASMNANGPTFSSKKVDMMIGLTLIVLLSACFNYTNLSLGRSLRRLKEISVRKVIGANRKQLFLQFMVEAILISFLALLIGLGLFLMLKPLMLDQVNFVLNNRPFFTLQFSFVQLGYFFLFTLIIGLISGMLPAWVLSRLKTSLIMNDAGNVRLLPGMNARKALITSQFSLSMGLIMSAVIVYQQYQFAINFDLGYQTDNIINVAVQGDYMELLAQDYAGLPQVTGTSMSQAVLGLRGGQFGNAISEDFEDTTMYSCNYVGSSYFEVYGFEFMAGTGELDAGNPNHIIVNERFLREMSFAAPEDAIGKKVRLWDEDQTILNIQGVVRDFMGVSLDFQMPEPFVFFPIPQGQRGTLGLKVATDDLLGTMAQLESYYQEYDLTHPFKAEFYNDQLSANYQQLKSTYTVISFLAFLAISISSLGLIGIAVYLIESRMKEISIRKVLGASTDHLVLLLSRGFSVMIIIAGMIAIPIAIYIADEMLLQSFFHRIEIGLIEMASGLVVVILIATISVGTQVHRVTHQKPAELLRDE